MRDDLQTTTEERPTATVERFKAIAVLQYVLRKRFYAFCRYYDPTFFSDDKPHLKLICDALQEITDGVTSHLMISMPPRSGKSYTASLWCAWTIGRGYRDSSISIMRNSYGQNLAEKFSYDIRTMLQARRFLDVFPEVALKADHQRIEDWAVTNASESTYFCSGVGGGITGKGCKTVAIADDLIKNLEDGLSDTITEKTWQWYKSVHEARLLSGCPQVHIATRWSRHDPIGMILESTESDKYKKIVIPALDDHGKSFCEAVRTTEEYLNTKNTTDEFIWECEYMQNPIEAKGLLYPVEQLHRFSIKELAADQISSITGFTDTADEGADFLASLSVAVSGKKCFVIDVVFTQEPVEITEALVSQQVIDNEHVMHRVESNSGGKGFARAVAAILRDRGCRCKVTWQPSTQNKETRILMSSGQVKEYFYFRNDYRPGSQYDKFMRQLTSYVKMGTNQPDDAPDALTGAAQMVLTPSMRFLQSKGRN